MQSSGRDSLGQHGQDVSDGVQCHRQPLAALDCPHPAAVQEVAGEGGQRGRGCPIGRHAQGSRGVGGLGKVFHVENERSPEVQRELVIPAEQTMTTLETLRSSPPVKVQ